MPVPGASTALLTDHYELTMLDAALQDGTAGRACSFEVFARHLPQGRRYGVVAGTGRLLDALATFRFDDAVLAHLDDAHVVSQHTLGYLASWEPRVAIDGYPEGECYFPGSPVLVVDGSFGDAVLLETLALSILNHDSAIASAASRMVVAAEGRRCIEMGSRRTHEEAAVACARSAYIAGFSATSNLEAGRRYGIPTSGTSAHAFTLLHDTEREAFASQVAALGPDTTVLVDTYDVEAAVRVAVEVAGPALGAVRLDSGDLGSLAVRVRELLDSLGATDTRIVVTSDLDEQSIKGLAHCPIDGYGVGTSLVTGSGAPTAGFVYKLVSVDGRPVAKRSTGKPSVGGRKVGWRLIGADGKATLERVRPSGAPGEPGERRVSVPLFRSGEAVVRERLSEARERHQRVLAELPATAEQLSRGTPVLRTEVVSAAQEELP
ncbi:MAG: nicotinate phosphoribosyltransferase [Frankiaceae bacterium]|nr:nicotinate phosphoribosyltransferase [Frankiaceae bacterium]